jgi:hypothetical protein
MVHGIKHNVLNIPFLIIERCSVARNLGNWRFLHTLYSSQFNDSVVARRVFEYFGYFTVTGGDRRVSRRPSSTVPRNYDKYAYKRTGN